MASPTLAQDAASLADGQPWQMENANGRGGELVLQPDGTGRMQMGVMSMRLTWQASADQLCITARIRGEQCVTLQSDGAGYAGYQDAELMFRLSRSGG